MNDPSGKTVGIPRALLYYRYRTLWRSFFNELGFNVVISNPTSKKTIDEGSSITIDEACLSLKIYLGHVKELIESGRCDYIFVPRVCNYGRDREFCARFQGLYDLTRNVFRDSGQKFITCSIDERQGLNEEAAFIALGQSLGFKVKESKNAYNKAKKADEKQLDTDIKNQEKLLKTDKMKILIAGHSYITNDNFAGKPVFDFLKNSGAVPIRADIVDRDKALKASKKISPTCKWEVNREILGGISIYKDRVDGIILLPAFPCGPDSMVNEIIIRKVKDIPVMNLVVDAQSGTAGVETRLESFLDIIRFKEGKL